jgi:hypothetical protein
MMMALLICPVCGAENDLTAERCYQCNASLMDLEPLDSLGQENGDGLPSPEEDLPGLLNALKNDAVSHPVIKQTEENLSHTSEESDESDIEEDAPEWLLRIRQRAQEEKDALGPITRKITAAEASLQDDNQESQRQNFESWLRQIQEGGQEGEIDMDGDFSDEAEMPEWLQKIRQSRETTTDSEHDGTSDGQDPSIQMPDWLGTRAVEPIDGKPTENESGVEGDHGLTEETIQVTTESAADEIPQESSQSDSGLLSPIKPVLSISPEEERHADHFLATIAAENLPKQSQDKTKKNQSRMLRVIFNLVLMMVMVLLALWGSNRNPTGHALQPHNAALISWTENLPSRATILVVMDYQPGFYSELSLIANPILRNIVTSDRDFYVLSSVPAGQLLFNRMIDKLGLETAISTQDLGYYPIAAYGAFGLGGKSTTDWGIANMPQSEKGLPVENYDGIMILADSIMGSRAWVEQLSALMPDNDIYLFLAAQAGPMLLPYWESGQVSGMVSGISEAAGIENALAQGSGVADRWRMYQVGIWAMLAVLAASPFLRPENQGRK